MSAEATIVAAGGHVIHLGVGDLIQFASGEPFYGRGEFKTRGARVSDRRIKLGAVIDCCDEPLLEGGERGEHPKTLEVQPLSKNADLQLENTGDPVVIPWDDVRVLVARK